MRGDRAQRGDAIGRLIDLALEEDLGDLGDVTSAAVVPSGLKGCGAFVARQPAVIAGTDVVARVFARVDRRVRVRFEVRDGDRVVPGQVLGTAAGPLRSLLAAERTALNFLQRLCGVATRGRQACEALGSGRCRLLDTRKTTPGWRTLEKAAVRAGGGANHRFGLFDGILIKDNHVAAVGSVASAVARARAGRRGAMPIEVEVTSLDQLKDALAAGADVVMLDNFPPEAVPEAVRRAAGRARVEVSGGVTFERLPAIAAAGADFVSLGSITHSAPAIDISFELEPVRSD